MGKRGEKAILRCTSDYGYGDHGSPPKIPGGATLNFEVELLDWKEPVKPPSEMTAEERRAHAAKMKEEGTAAFKLQDWATAVNRWEDGVEYLENKDEDDYGGQGHTHGGQPCSGHGDDDETCKVKTELSSEDKTMIIAMLNNSAMARLKLNEPDAAKFDCIKVLEYDKGNVKAFFRRGQAELAMGNFDATVENAAQVIELDPQNKEAEQLRRKALDGVKQAKQKEKAMAQKMFG